MNVPLRGLTIDSAVEGWMQALKAAGFEHLPSSGAARALVADVLDTVRSLLASDAKPREETIESLQPLAARVGQLHTAQDGVHIPGSIRAMYLLEQVILDKLDPAEASALSGPKAERRIRDFFNELVATASESWTLELQNVLDSTINGIVIMDPNAKVRLVNRHMVTLFALNPLQVIGADVRESLLPEIARQLKNPEEFDTQSRYFYEHLDEEIQDELQLDGPDPRFLFRYGGPVRDEAGRFLGRIEVYNDVTAQRRAEQVKDEFLSIAAHELRTPITSLKGYAQLLQRAALRGDGGLEPATVSERLAAMMRQIERLADLVDDLLEVSRIQTGRLALRLETVELGELVEQVTERFREDPTLAQRHAIEVRDVKQPLIGNWDPGRLDQVLSNLITNAIKYSPSGGSIRIRLGRSGEMARVSISDQGIGIPADERAKLFQPFARAANASIRNFGGIGLGLFISRDIIERHGGQIWLESEEGKGSTFYFTLPLRHRALNPSEDE